jgi:arylformamidase
MPEYRASFDAAVTFSNGGNLSVHGFRVDVPSVDVDNAEIAALFVASLGLLMTDSIKLSNVEVFPEPHKGTRGGPSDHSRDSARIDGRFVELCAHHRYPDGADPSAIPLSRTVDLPTVVVRVSGTAQRGIDVGSLAALDVEGAAVLLHTGDDTRFGTPAYVEEQHFLTHAGANWLADHGAVLVAIDGLNIDDTTNGERAAHTRLLAAGIPVIENLTGLDQLPPTGARFSAVPLRIEALGTIPVRAFARVFE